MKVLLLFVAVASLTVVNSLPVDLEDEDVVGLAEIEQFMESGEYEAAATPLIDRVLGRKVLSEQERDVLDKATAELHRELARTLQDNLDMKKQKFLYDMDKEGIDSGIVESREKIVGLCKKMKELGEMAQMGVSPDLDEDARAHFLTMAGEFAFRLAEVEEEDNDGVNLSLHMYKEAMSALMFKYRPRVPVDHKLYVRLNADRIKSFVKADEIDEAFAYALNTQLDLGQLYTEERKKEIVTEVVHHFERLMRERKEAEE